MENDQKIARTTFEKEILSQVFRYIDPRDYPFESEMFRGDVYPFAVYDSDMEEVYFGDESLFGRYNITEFGH